MFRFFHHLCNFCYLTIISYKKNFASRSAQAEAQALAPNIMTRVVHLFSKLNKLLLSHGQFFDAGMKSILTKDKLIAAMDDISNQIMLEFSRSKSDGMWCINLEKAVNPSMMIITRSNWITERPSMIITIRSNVAHLKKYAQPTNCNPHINNIANQDIEPAEINNKSTHNSSAPAPTIRKTIYMNLNAKRTSLSFISNNVELCARNLDYSH